MAVKKKVAKKKAVKKKAAKKKAAKKKVAKKKVAKKKVAKKKVVKKKAPKTLSARQIALRRLLIEQRENILKEAQAEIAKYIKGENRQLVETALDDGDWSVIDLSEDISFRKLGTHRETLLKIDEALRKIDENTYGT